jgi:serine/threonine protein phosphatase PrpC/CRP-like cAMP-binding protein
MGCASSTPVQVDTGKNSLMDGRSEHVNGPQHRTPMKESAKTTNGAVKTVPAASAAPAVVKKPPSKPINRAHDRVVASEETLTLESDGIKLRYAFVSQRGHYPDDPYKANQDSYCIHETLLGSNTSGTHKDKKDALFGVFDGHGQAGDGCAIFARTQLPVSIKNHIEKIKPKKNAAGDTKLVTKDDIQTAILKAHVETNKALRRNPKIDDSLSGTTAISMYLHGRRNRITIANVGDSRAVLGQLPPSIAKKGTIGVPPESARTRNLKALPLSKDQTPYRKDERARIRATGARIMSLDQLEGLEPIVEGESENMDCELGEELDEGGDPPRVWAANGDYPGTAFTRSIGDAMAEELGVFSEPELLTRELGPEDKIIVIATDGVFEFLTNQSVIDICAKFTDPLEACRAVVAEAYELWLQYELRTDDITMICMFLDEVKPVPGRRDSLGSSMGSSKNLGEAAAVEVVPSLLPADDVDNSVMSTEGLRPVRKNVSVAKSKAIEKLKATQANAPAEEEVDWRQFATEKTKEEKESIAEAIKASIMFRNINDAQREMLYSCMESVDVKAGEWVIRQGSAGDRFYIIDDGRFEVRLLPDDEEDLTGQGGNTIHCYEGSREKNAHPAFGELALMYSAPRSASIVAQTDGHLWALHRSAFRQVLMEAKGHRSELKRILGEIPYFQYLDSDGINKLATIMDERTFARGESITEQGRPGSTMYVIQSGTCYGVQMTQEGTKRSNLKAGGHFGDEVFSGDGKYQTTVVSLQTTSCWQLDADVLKKTMGPLLRAGKADAAEADEE